MLHDIPYEILTPADVGLSLKVPETGNTFEENAREKAVAYAEASRLVTLADDSGLEVEALQGAPGVRSRRFAGEDVTDEVRNSLLLEKLKDVAWEKRTARFCCVMAVVDIQKRVHLCEGECPGLIGFAPRGQGGFGYDPVFYLPEFDKTMAELTPEQKDAVSHRGKAAAKAREILLRLK